jgi:hypothetical protein
MLGHETNFKNGAQSHFVFSLHKSLSKNSYTMGLLDPSEDDQNQDKKPRFLQDFAVVIILVGAFLLYFILDWLVF